jgi:hypothetical protein
MSFVAAMYLCDALLEGFRTGRWPKLVKFGWMSLSVVASKILVNAIVWAVNL